jgi:trans-aconitate methyltransferase
MSNQWNAGEYQSRYSFVWEAAGELIGLLAPQPGERILDLGCGPGQLTARIAESGAMVTGIDRSEAMIAQARGNYPLLDFRLGDAASFTLDERTDAPVDAVFSNAVLHWVTDASGVARCIERALKPGGRFVCEFGGRGNIASVARALEEATGQKQSDWYYPSISEYSAVLEGNGLEVRFATLFDRPIQVEGANGMDDLLKTFRSALTAEARAEVVARLRPERFDGGVWTFDYRRLRVVAVKPAVKHNADRETP